MLIRQRSFQLLRLGNRRILYAIYYILYVRTKEQIIFAKIIKI